MLGRVFRGLLRQKNNLQVACAVNQVRFAESSAVASIPKLDDDPEIQKLNKSIAPEELKSLTSVAKGDSRFSSREEEDQFWDRIDAFITTDEGKKELSGLKRAWAEYEEASKPQELEEIDWNEFKDVDPSIVNMYKDALSKIKGEVEKNHSFEELRNQYILDTRKGLSASAKQINELAEHSEKRIVEIEDELKSLEKQKVARQTRTIRDEFAANPKLAEEIDREIMEGNYMPESSAAKS